MSVLLEVEHLDVRIPLTAGVLHPVRDVSFSVRRGDVLCIVGESGCGKSLTSLALMNLLPARARRSAQKLAFDGIDLLRLDERAMADLRGNGMAMIFQEPMTSLNPCYTIGTQLTEVLRRHRRVSGAQARDRALQLLEKVGVTAGAERLGQYPHQLSGGLRQRVMIAMALMCSPKLLFADVTIQAQILHLLASIRRELDMAVILITHDLGIVARVATHAAVMYAGEIVETGTARELFARPTHPYTQGLLRCIPVPGRTKRRARLGSIRGLVPSLIGDTAGCAFRNRCPYAFEACARTQVALAELSPGRAYRCLIPPEQCAANAAEAVPAAS
jgi:peptide/nickel transport system ATP-binding protein